MANTEISVQRTGIKRSRPRIKDIWSFMQRWPVGAGTIISLMVLIAIFAPVVAPHDPYEHSFLDANKPPLYVDDRGLHLLGTDQVGRDLLSRLIYGARVSLMVAAIGLVSGTLIGTALGLAAGFLGGVVDEVITRIVDIWIGFPFIMLALVISLMLGGSVTTMVILLALASWQPFVRLVRGEVLSLRTRPFVDAARVAGASSGWLMSHHMLPGVINTVLVVATLQISSLILAESFLSFLGVGIPPPTPSWGLMISDGRSNMREAWWIGMFPGIFLAITVGAMSFFGDWVRDFLDPRLRQTEKG